jgi:hypothetical protein
VTATIIPFDPRRVSNEEMWARPGLPPIAWSSRDDLLRGAAIPQQTIVSGSRHGGDIFPTGLLDR